MINPVTGLKKGAKKVREKFGSSKKVPTFAIPFETRGLTKTASGRQGVRKRGAEVPEYDEVH